MSEKPYYINPREALFGAGLSDGWNIAYPEPEDPQTMYGAGALFDIFMAGPVVVDILEDNEPTNE